MKIFQSMRDSTVCFAIVAAVSSVTMVLPEQYVEFQEELALACLQSEKEDKRHVIAKTCKIQSFVKTKHDPLFYIA